MPAREDNEHRDLDISRRTALKSAAAAGTAWALGVSAIASIAGRTTEADELTRILRRYGSEFGHDIYLKSTD